MLEKQNVLSVKKIGHCRYGENVVIKLQSWYRFWLKELRAFEPNLAGKILNLIIFWTFPMVVTTSRVDTARVVVLLSCRVDRLAKLEKDDDDDDDDCAVFSFTQNFFVYTIEIVEATFLFVRPSVGFIWQSHLILLGLPFVL